MIKSIKDLEEELKFYNDFDQELALKLKKSLNPL